MILDLRMIESKPIVFKPVSILIFIGIHDFSLLLEQHTLLILRNDDTRVQLFKFQEGEKTFLVLLHFQKPLSPRVKKWLPLFLEKYDSLLLELASEVLRV